MTDVPTLSRYEDQRHVSMPIGGIGTGTIGIGGRGQLRDFELGNRPAKGFRPGHASFVLRAETERGAVARVLEGPLDDADFDGDLGSPTANHGFPRFRESSFAAAYPFAVVTLRDPDMPTVYLEAFNPLVPGQLDASSIPASVLRFRIRNDCDLPLHLSLAASFENFIGANGTVADTGGNANFLREGAELVGIEMTADDLPQGHEAAGTFCVATLRSPDGHSARTGWKDGDWSTGLLDFWEDFVDDGRLEERRSEADRPIASLAPRAVLAPGEETTFTFLLTWSFPNRRAWRSDDFGPIHIGQYTDDIVGNHYSTTHPDPWATAEWLAGRMDDLEARTARVTRAIIDSDLPQTVKEAGLSNLSTLRSPTLFRTADGEFYGWEGVRDRVGSCFGTCTHVWAYEFATSLWFADIAWSMRRTQYLRSTEQTGAMSFRAGLPSGAEDQWQVAAADGQMATLVHLYYDWKLSGDDNALRELWPSARRSLEFSWAPGGWDADEDGVMEGCQHNTMDVEYYGPNPQMQGWYLAALRAVAAMARAMNDTKFAVRCESLFARGSEWADMHLFNGAYYEHHIEPIADPSKIAPRLRQERDDSDPSNPVLQLGDGILIDQLVGQYASRLVGIGSVFDPENVRTTATTVYVQNHRDEMWGHFNHMRGYALDDESAVLMATYPHGRPADPFPYFNEVMTGFEYVLALNHIQDGDRDLGVSIIADVRRRHTGRRRNPFDETECGRHYTRAMASWSAFVAWNGFEWDATAGEMRFTLEEGTTFWSTGRAAGAIRVGADGVELEIFEGGLPIQRLIVCGDTFDLTGAQDGRRSWILSRPRPAGT